MSDTISTMMLKSTYRQLRYVLLTDTPFRNRTTMMIRELAPNQVELEWSATFEPEGIPANEAVDLLAGALAVSCVALMPFMEASRQ